MLAAVVAAPEDRRLAFLRGHPELGGVAARGGQLGSHSTAEQAALGLERLAEDRAADIQRLTAAYQARFGFPFIVCVGRRTRRSILEQMHRRLDHDSGQERATALAEIGLITRLRLVAAVEGPGAPPTTGSLTTHVLDTAAGRPAACIPVTLFGGGRRRDASPGPRHH